MIHGRDLTKIGVVDHAKISEQIAHSWYDYSVGDDKGLNPFQGETSPHYTGPKPPFERLDTAQKYSWLKSPRYDGAAMEVGPLARMLVAYAKGSPPRAKVLVDKVLTTLGVGPEALFSTLGRIAARAIETQVLVESIGRWVEELADNMARRDYRIQDNSKWEPEHLAARVLRRRLPRGAARRARPLGAYQQRLDRQLPVRGAEHLERRPARRHGPARSLRSRAGRARRSPSPSSRWKSCARCIPSTPAWPAACTSSTRPSASWRG